MTNHDLDYAWSDDRGRNWFNNTSHPIGERGRNAITLNTPGVRVVEIGMNRGLANATTQAVDSKDQIHLVTFHLPDDAAREPDWKATREKTRYFHYWRASDGQWQRNEMNFIGSRPQLWFDKNDNAYLVFVGDRFNPSPDLSIAAASAKSHSGGLENYSSRARSVQRTATTGPLRSARTFIRLYPGVAAAGAGHVESIARAGFQTLNRPFVGLYEKGRSG